MHTKSAVNALLNVIIDAILLAEWIDFSTFAPNLQKLLF